MYISRGSNFLASTRVAGKQILGENSFFKDNETRTEGKNSFEEDENLSGWSETGVTIRISNYIKTEKDLRG